MLITFRFKYPISRTMVFEKEYHPNLQFSLREKRQLLKNAITIWMFNRGIIVGESYGVPLNQIGEIPEGCPHDPKSIYCYSTTILSRYQGNGYGRILKAAFIGRVARDFHTIYGHARPGASQTLNKSFGARLRRTYKDWYGTGEDYRLYVLSLGGLLFWLFPGHIRIPGRGLTVLEGSDYTDFLRWG
jgi:hypothetical protein